MPLSFCQIVKDDIKLLELLSQQITSDYVFASFWDCYQYKAKQSPQDNIYVTTAEVAKYTLNELLNIFKKQLHYNSEVKSDFCIVNHKIIVIEIYLG